MVIIIITDSVLCQENISAIYNAFDAPFFGRPIEYITIDGAADIQSRRINEEIFNDNALEWFELIQGVYPMLR